MTNESNTFAGWVESPFHMAWRENLTASEQGDVAWIVSLVKNRDCKSSDWVLIAKMSMMLDTLTALNARTEAQRMELLMPHE